MSKEEIRLVDRYKDKVRCNLCNKEMTLENYDKHYDRCLMVTTLVKILKEKGEEVDYETLSQYDSTKLEKIIFKYIPFRKDLICKKQKQ